MGLRILSTLFIVTVLWLISDFASASESSSAKEDSKSEVTPWNETLTQVRALKAQRGQALSNLNKVRDEMRHLKENSPQMKAKGAEYAKLYKEYREVSQEYNQQLAILKYRFPDRLAKEQNRQYQTVEIESETELAQKLDLDSRLSATMQRSRDQYADRSQEKQRSPVPSKTLNPEGPQTIREEEAILLSK